MRTKIRYARCVYGTPGLYNRNQIRDKLLLVLIFEINEVRKNDGTLE